MENTQNTNTTEVMENNQTQATQVAAQQPTNEQPGEKKSIWTKVGETAAKVHNSKVVKVGRKVVLFGAGVAAGVVASQMLGSKDSDSNQDGSEVSSDAATEETVE